jgi:pimeloyl-ACP methyl ester carboxylesterase
MRNIHGKIATPGALALALWALAAGATPGHAQNRADGVVVHLATRPGVTLRYLANEPDRAPAAAAILLVGGVGAPGFPDPPRAGWAREGNFLPRSRELFRQRAIYTAVPGAPSDHASGLGAFRLSAEHAEDIAAVAADLRRRARGAPVWLIGTSNGTLSAANAAARLPPGAIDGVVLTATVTVRGRAANMRGGLAVFDVDLARIRVPALLAHHRDDACVASPFAAMESVRARLTGAARVELLAFSGGDPPRSGACDPLAPHGFLGIEAQVVEAIAAWMTR